MEIVQAYRKDKRIHFAFPEVPRSGRDVLSIQGVEKGFGGAPLYRELSLTVLRQQKAGCREWLRRNPSFRTISKALHRSA